MFIKIGAVVVQVCKVIVPILRRTYDVLKHVFGKVAHAVGVFARAMAKVGSAFYDHIIQPVVDTLYTWFERFKHVLNKVFAPILKAIEWVNKVLDKVWAKVIQPILDVLERIRMIFKGLGMLGVDWAQALADIIEQIERQIYESFEKVREILNTIVYYIDTLLDPAGWIRGAPFLRSITKWGPGCAAIISALGIEPGHQERLDERKDRVGPVPFSEGVTAFWNKDVQKHAAVILATSQFKRGETGRG